MNFHGVKGGECVELIKWIIVLAVSSVLTLALSYLIWRMAMRDDESEFKFAFYVFIYGAMFAGICAISAGVHLISVI